MNKLIYSIIALVMISSSVFAQTAAPTMTIKGSIICNKCMGKTTTDNLDAFLKDHPKECMLHAGCAASGYSLVSNGKVQKFNKASEAQIKEFLGKPDSKTSVEVTASDASGELLLVSIKNQ